MESISPWFSKSALVPHAILLTEKGEVPLVWKAAALEYQEDGKREQGAGGELINEWITFDIS
jgi:hypothetical protein